MENSKIVISIGNHSFNAEGPGEVVTKLYASFEKLVQKEQELAGKRQGKPQEQAEEDDAEEQNDVKERDAKGKNTPLGQSKLLKDIFTYDEGKNFLVLHGEPTASNKQEVVGKCILLLLWGYKKLKDQDEVKALILKKILNQMGTKVDRFDRSLADYLDQGYLTKVGNAKGTSYRISNKGLAKAEEFAIEHNAKLS